MVSSLLLRVLLGASIARAALDVDISSPDSLKAGAKLAAANLWTYYHGEQPGRVPGILDGPPPDGDYYWWQGGAMWGTYVDYWYYTSDATYVNSTKSALIFQAAGHDAYMGAIWSYQPRNWSLSLGNDDQGFWGLSAMLAAERGFPNPPDGTPGWLALAQGVWNTQQVRYHLDNLCGGGLHWQIVEQNIGFDYKNTISNGIFFNLGARLARYTDNATYAEWAEKAWDWLLDVKYVDAAYNVYDGAHTTDPNCTSTVKVQYSYNAAVLIEGAAFMWNYTDGKNPKWETAIRGLINRTLEFFFLAPENVMVERSCEMYDRLGCNTDMLSFKGYMHRWLATATQVAPWTADLLLPALESSTKGLINSCNPDGVCGFRWNRGAYEGPNGAGQQMNAVAALTSILVSKSPGLKGPLTNSTGGTSQGNPNTGLGTPELPDKPITLGDRAGAGILTALALGSLLSGLWFVHMCELAE